MSDEIDVDTEGLERYEKKARRGIAEWNNRISSSGNPSCWEVKNNILFEF